MPRGRDRDRDRRHGDLAAGVTAAVGGRAQAEATAAATAGGKDLVDVLGKRTGVGVAFKQGTAHELLEATKFNIDSALKGSDLHAHATVLSDVHAAADIEIRSGVAGPVVRQAQDKSYATAVGCVREQSNPKYTGMQRLVPEDLAEDCERLLDRRQAVASPDHINHDRYEDVRANLTGELHHEDVRSGGTTRTEADAAAADPGMASRRLVRGQVAGELAHAGKTGAAIGGVTSGVVSGLANAQAVRRGEKTHADAVVDTVVATAQGAVTGAGTAVSGKAIEIGLRRCAPTRLAGGGGAGAIAGATLQMAGVTKRWVAGDLDDEAFRREATAVAIDAGAAYWGGVIGQAVVPVPVVGALLGSFAASLMVGAVRKARAEQGAATLRRHELDLELAAAGARLEQLNAEVTRSTAAQEGLLDETLLPALSDVRFGLLVGDVDIAGGGIRRIRGALGTGLQHADRAALDAAIAARRKP